jgi:hypothetical protein
MSPVSRRRPSRGPRRGGPPGGADAEAALLRGRPPLDVLTRELTRVEEAEDAFLAEGLAGYVVGLLDVRGPEGGPSFETFCREVVDDARATTSLRGLAAVTVLAELGHPSVRALAAGLAAAADPALVAALPPWCAHVGRVHVVEAGSLRTRDGSETVLHVMLDYDEPAAGSRHLVSVAVERGEQRVHLLDVRARGPQDSLAPVAEQYAASPTARWQWRETDELDELVGDPVRTTWTRAATDWPVQDIEGKPTPAWAFGVRRLERLSGVSMRPQG